ncbi:hypothetical protein DCC81_14620 [Chitinophaga parva]|uniref:Alpha-galactosidase NEW3 domain-containing protein n=1 Tax=Chitinophaga parva TaxID=2169414 RepID=A0A2T7BGW2_9BACT|nr:NEW3 domain-containing protein [Chitinophaga parva]PUZ25515.1 hypothetical protein DCC81_14620 [Chitinophaga parva]
MLKESLPTRSRKSYWTRYLLCIVFFTGHTMLKAQQPASAPDAKSEFTVRLINIEAAVNETFRFNATLHNAATTPVVYELSAGAPPGWMVAFRVQGTPVTALNLLGAKSEDISIEMNPSPGTKPGKYTVPVRAVSGRDTLALALEAVVKGSYGVDLSTPTGRLSDDVTSGAHKEIHLTVKNTGTLPLKDLDISAQLPSQWECTFDPAKITQLDPDKSQEVIAKMSVPDKTIAGDYATTFNVRNPESNAQAVFRVTVKTSLLAGWIGILVILAALGLVYYLIRRYGRR